MPGYQVVPIQLEERAGQPAAAQIVPPGVEILTVAVLKSPAGFEATVKAGTGGQEIQLPQEGQGIKLCPPTNEGLYILVPAGQAGQLRLGINVELFGASTEVLETPRIVYSRYQQAGSVNSGPAIQLRNGTVDKIIRVLSVYVESATAAAIWAVLHRRQISNNGGGVLTAGNARYLDRRKAPDNPILATRDAGIVGQIAGSTFDNQLFVEFAGGGATPPVAEVIELARGPIGTTETPLKGQVVTLNPGWALTVQQSQNGAGVQLSATFVATEE